MEISDFVDEFESHFALLLFYSNHIVLLFWKLEIESNDDSRLDALAALRKTDI